MSSKENTPLTISLDDLPAPEQNDAGGQGSPSGVDFSGNGMGFSDNDANFSNNGAAQSDDSGQMHMTQNTAQTHAAQNTEQMHTAAGFERLTLGDVLKDDSGSAPGSIPSGACNGPAGSGAGGTSGFGGQPFTPGAGGASDPFASFSAGGADRGASAWSGPAATMYPSSDAAGAFSGGYAPGGPPPTSGGAWVWNPSGYEPKKTWRKRHPFLFWGGTLAALLLVFLWGRFSSESSPIAGPKIAVVKIEGVIMESGPIVSFIEQVRKDASYKGAIVRIDSPGGGVGASQEIYAAISRLSKEKPTIASMGATAASGGYYAAIGANEIVAGPSTLTGSIGVKMQIPNMEGLMRTVGISETTLTTGKLKDAGSSWRAMTSEENAYFKGLLNDMYEEFLASIAAERKMPLEKVRAVADGRALTGRQALKAGLVDSLGDFQAAVGRIKDLCALPADKDVHLVVGPEEKREFLDKLVRSMVNSLQEQQMTAGRPYFLY